MRKVIVRVLASVFVGVVIASVGVVYDKNNTSEVLGAHRKRIRDTIANDPEVIAALQRRIRDTSAAAGLVYDKNNDQEVLEALALGYFLSPK